MKKFTAIFAFIGLGTSLSFAQTTESSVESRSGKTVEKSNEAQVQRLENMQRLEGNVSTERTPVKTVPTLEQLDASIAELEKHIQNNEGKEGFDKAAYQRRLEYLQKKKAEGVSK